MKNHHQNPPLSVLLIPVLFFYTINILQADPQNNPPPIINPKSLKIQHFNTQSCNSWPGVRLREDRPKGNPSTSDTPLIKTFPLEDRLILVFNQALINLNQSGMPDRETLISLFVSQTRHPEIGTWSPESGTLTSDGIWRGFTTSSLRPLIFSLNLSTASIHNLYWEDFLPRRLKPAGSASILIEQANAFKILQFQNRKVHQYGPFKPERPISYLAISPISGQIAYLEALGGRVHFLDITTALSSDNPSPPKKVAEITIPPGPFGMDFAGNSLIVAYPGKLLIIQHPIQPMVQTFHHPDIPLNWYNIYGGPQRLVIHSPRNPKITIISPADSALSPLSLEGTSFSRLLEEQAIPAARALMEQDSPRQNPVLQNPHKQNSRARDFLLWLLPHIREQRAINPLNTAWPRLESQSQEILQKLRHNPLAEASDSVP